MIEAFRQEAVSMAAAVEKEKQRAIGLRLLVDSVVKKKEDDRRRLMVPFNKLSSFSFVLKSRVQGDHRRTSNGTGAAAT